MKDYSKINKTIAEAVKTKTDAIQKMEEKLAAAQEARSAADNERKLALDCQDSEKYAAASRKMQDESFQVEYYTQQIDIARKKPAFSDPDAINREIASITVTRTHDTTGKIAEHIAALYQLLDDAGKEIKNERSELDRFCRSAGEVGALKIRDEDTAILKKIDYLLRKAFTPACNYGAPDIDTPYRAITPTDVLYPYTF